MSVFQILNVEGIETNSGLFVDSSGLVGVGVTSFLLSNLHVRGTFTNNVLRIEDSSTNVIAFIGSGTNSGVAIGSTNLTGAVYTNPKLVLNTGTDVGLMHLNGLGVELVTFMNTSDSVFGNASNHDLAFITNNVERIKITAAGNVGINHLTPPAKLTIVGSGNTSSTHSLRIANSSSVVMIDAQDDGKVGIGTSAPASTFDIQSTVASQDIQRWISNSGAERMRITDTGQLLLNTTTAASISSTDFTVSGRSFLGDGDSFSYNFMGRYSAAVPYSFLYAAQNKSAFGTAGFVIGVTNGGTPRNGLTIDSLGNVVIDGSTTNPNAASALLDLVNRPAGTNIFRARTSGGFDMFTITDGERLQFANVNSDSPIGTNDMVFAFNLAGGYNFKGGTNILWFFNGTVQSYQAIGPTYLAAGTYSNHGYILRTNNSDQLTISATGDVTIAGLAGTGNRVVEADSTGKLIAGAAVVGSAASKVAFTFTPGTAGSPNTITHGLGTTDFTVTLWDLIYGEIIYAKVSNRTTTQVDITFTANPAGNVRIVLVG